MKSFPYLVQSDSEGSPLSSIGTDHGIYNEIWLQQLIRKHPDLLPLQEVDPIFSPLVSIGREVATSVGPIDNLLISPRGYLVLVETKLWRNPDAKRTVIGQVIDYTKSLSTWKYQTLNAAVQAYTAQYEGGESSLVDLVERKTGPIEIGRDFFEDTVTKNLNLGRFLIVIVGDAIRPEVVEMMGDINRYIPHLAAEVALIELRCFHLEEKNSWPLLVAPSVVAKTEIIERSVVQVSIKQDGSHTLEVHHDVSEKHTKERRGTMLTEEAFWELLKHNSPRNFIFATELIEIYRVREAIAIDPTESSLVVRMYLPDSGQNLSLFFIDKKGRVNVWLNTISQQLTKASLNSDLVRSYGAEIRKIFNSPSNRLELGREISTVDLVAFKNAVDEFIQIIQIAPTPG